MENNNMLHYGRLVDHYARKSRAFKVPFAGTFELTPRCNMNCRMCYIRMTEQEMAKVGRELTVEQWMTIARAAVDRGMVMLLLTGGEAVLYKDFKKLYLELRKMGLFISINTNGTMFTEEWFSFFDRYPPAQLNVTLYGGSNETYDRLCRNPKGFDQVKTNIDKMLAHHFRVHLNVTLTKQNAADMEAIYAFGRERGLTVHGNTYCFPPVRKEGVENPEQSRFTPKEAAEARVKLNWYGMNDRDRFLQWANQIFTDLEHANRPGEEVCGKIEGDRVLCAAGRANFWITWDGRMLPCGMIPNMTVSMKNNEFDQAWAEIVRETGKITLTPECAVCPQKSLCLPCAAKIISETGTYSGRAEYLCEYTDEYIRLLGEAVKYLEHENC